MQKNINSNLRLYADDTTDIIKNTNSNVLKALQQHDLVLFKGWFSANNLCLNEKKTTFHSN